MDKNNRLCCECRKKEGFWMVDDVYICDDCYDKFYDCCDECYAILPQEKIVKLQDGSRYCKECLSKDYGLCAECGQWVSKRELVNGVCKMCREYYN